MGRKKGKGKSATKTDVDPTTKESDIAVSNVVDDGGCVEEGKGGDGQLSLASQTVGELASATATATTSQHPKPTSTTQLDGEEQKKDCGEQDDDADGEGGMVDSALVSKMLELEEKVVHWEAQTSQLWAGVEELLDETEAENERLEASRGRVEELAEQSERETQEMSEKLAALAEQKQVATENNNESGEETDEESLTEEQLAERKRKQREEWEKEWEHELEVKKDEWEMDLLCRLQALMNLAAKEKMGQPAEETEADCQASDEAKGNEKAHTGESPAE